MHKVISFTIIVIISLYSSFQAQTHGKIYSQKEADDLYGPVLERINISTTQLTSLFDKASEFMMFSIIDKNLVILGKTRNLIYSSGLPVFQTTDVFVMFSTSKIKELVDTGRSDETIIERRENVLTISNGAITLEYGVHCPPYCD